MFGHFLQAFYLTYDFSSTFKQLTLVSSYSCMAVLYLLEVYCICMSKL